MKYSFILVLMLISTSLLNVHARSIQKNANTTVQLPYDRMIQPAGKLIVFGDSTKENHALDCALSPDKKWLAVEERYSIVFINTTTNEVKQVLFLDSIPELKEAMNTYSGICWYKKDNIQSVFFSTSLGKDHSYVVQLKWDGIKATVTKKFDFKPVAPSKLALQNEIIVREENDRMYLYVVLNGNNQLVKLDVLTGKTSWIKNTGIAPYGIAWAKNKLYVTNWGGSIPDNNDVNVAGVPWGKAKIDSTTAACREGSVNVYDPFTGKLLKVIVVGLHPNKIITSPDENYVYLTNSNSDEVSVIDTKNDGITESISLRLQKGFNHYSGDTPNSLAVTSSGKTLFVANGMDNALSMITLGKKASTTGMTAQSRIEGFIPTAAYPSGISIGSDKTLYVTNLESFGANQSFGFGPAHKPVFNSHHELASVSVSGFRGNNNLPVILKR